MKCINLLPLFLLVLALPTPTTTQFVGETLAACALNCFWDKALELSDAGERCLGRPMSNTCPACTDTVWLEEVAECVRPLCSEEDYYLSFGGLGDLCVQKGWEAVVVPKYRRDEEVVDSESSSAVPILTGGSTSTDSSFGGPSTSSSSSGSGGASPTGDPEDVDPLITDPPQSKQERNKPSTPVIAGAVAGGAGAIVIAGALWWILKQRRQTFSRGGGMAEVAPRGQPFTMAKAPVVRLDQVKKEARRSLQKTKTTR